MCNSATSNKVPVRYRPNAASVGGAMGVTLHHCREKGNTHFKPVASCY